MKKKTIVVAISILCMCLLTGCGCEHEWLDATCTSAKTCSLCGETEGEPTGHNWASATCETARQCKTCSIEVGNPLGHTPRKTETIDFVNCTKHLEQHCPTCGQLLDSADEDLDSFVVDDLFIFSPQEFMERMESISKQYYPDFSYELNHSDADIYLEKTDLPSASLYFNKDSANQAKIESIELSVHGSSEDFGSLISADILKLLYLSCDPLLGDADYTEFALAKVTTAANAISYDQNYGYLEKNGLLYEFFHFAVAPDAWESIEVYASNWL